MVWKPPKGSSNRKFNHTIYVDEETNKQLIEISLKTNTKITVLIRSMVAYCLTEEVANGE